jgi:hypothetical protein
MKWTAVMLLLASSTLWAGSNLVGNSSFATPATTSYIYDPNPAANPWVFLGNSGIAAQGSAFFNATPLDGGHQAAFLQQDGLFFQYITGLTPNDQVAITFDYAARGITSGDDFLLYFYNQNLPPGLNFYTVSAPTTKNFTQSQEYDFTATGNTEVVVFEGFDPSYADLTTIISNVSVVDNGPAQSLIPEPGTLGSLGLALGGGLVFLIRFRERHNRA